MSLIINLCLCVLGCLFALPCAYGFNEGTLPSGAYQGAAQGGNIPAATVPTTLQGVTVEEHLGKFVDLHLSFVDEWGRTKTMEQILENKPLMVTLNYFRCQSLCGLQLDRVANVMNKLDWQIGKDFNMASISFDKTDTSLLAMNMYRKYTGFLNQKQAPWHFYTATDDVIKAISSQLGFYYRYDAQTNSFAHTAAMFFIAPNGKITRYLYGISYNPVDIKFALIDTSHGKIGTTVDRVLLTCFHYNATTGQYDAFAYGLLRIAAASVLVILFSVLGYFFYKEKKKKRE